MAETKMIAPAGERIVRRPHTRAESPLRAWSAADQLALDHFGTRDLGQVLIVNDEFGALTVGLAERHPTVWTDSTLSRSSIDANLACNGFEPLRDRAIPGDEHPIGIYDTVVIRIPKTLALLETQLAAVASLSRPDTQIVGTGMARHIHRSTLQAFEASLGATTTSRAQRKARLIYSTCDTTTAGVAGQELRVTREFRTDSGIVVCELPGTFSNGHVDVGTALLLEVLTAEGATIPKAGQIGDLGCGNGIIAATLARHLPATDWLVTDVSDLAVAAARSTWHRNDLDPDRAQFRVVDGLGGVADRSLAAVVTNPPFHQGHAADTALTDRILNDAARAIAGDGVVFAVAQRHLQFHTRMRRWFGEVQVCSQHPSHVVLEARHPTR